MIIHSLHWLITIPKSIVFFLKNEDERDLINILILHQFLVTLVEYFFGVLNADDLHGLAEVLNWNGLDAEDVIGVEEGFKVILIKISLTLTLGILELVDSLGMWICLGLLLHRFQIFTYAIFSILWPLIKHSSQNFIE